MAKIVCVDALVYWAGAVFTERNDASVSIDVDIAEARPFVANMAAAYAAKTATWKSWTASLSGYYDDTNNAVQNAIRDGTTAQLVIYPSRADLTAYWYGNALVSSVEHGITSEDYSELNAEFEGSGALTWHNV